MPKGDVKAFYGNTTSELQKSRSADGQQEGRPRHGLLHHNGGPVSPRVPLALLRLAQVVVAPVWSTCFHCNFRNTEQLLRQAFEMVGGGEGGHDGAGGAATTAATAATAASAGDPAHGDGHKKKKNGSAPAAARAAAAAAGAAGPHQLFRLEIEHFWAGNLPWEAQIVAPSIRGVVTRLQ